MAIVISAIFTVLLVLGLVWQLYSGKVGVDDPAFSADRRIDPKRYWFLISMNVLLVAVFAFVVLKNA